MHIDIRQYWTRTSAILTTSSTSLSAVTETSTSLSVATLSSTILPISTTSVPGSITEMPSLSSILTSTLTGLVTTTSAIPGFLVVTDAIRGLSDCTQDVLFPLLANSECNPANFPCICTELQRLNARNAVASKCSPDDLARKASSRPNFILVMQLTLLGYDDFSVATCGNVGRIDTATGTSVAPIIPSTTGTSVALIIPSTTGTSVAPIIPSTTGAPIVIVNSTTTQGPFSNGTTASVEPSTVVPLPPIFGAPTTQTEAGPATPTGPSNPSFIGGGAAVEIPAFSGARMSMLAGAIGLMGLVFAEL